MHPSFNIDAPSPDGQHTAQLLFSGEVRFGPAYYVLSVDGYSFGGRIFGGAHLWSPSSRFLAVQEWLTLDYSEGPITELVLLDLQLRQAAVARATKGFLVPIAFADPLVTYRAEYAGPAGVQHFTLDITSVAEWLPLA